MPACNKYTATVENLKYQQSNGKLQKQNIILNVREKLTRNIYRLCSCWRSNFHLMEFNPALHTILISHKYLVCKYRNSADFKPTVNKHVSIMQIFLTQVKKVN